MAASALKSFGCSGSPQDAYRTQRMVHCARRIDALRVEGYRACVVAQPRGPHGVRASVCRLDDVFADGDGNGFEFGVGVEFVEDALYVVADGVDADEEVVGDGGCG